MDILIIILMSIGFILGLEVGVLACFWVEGWI